MIPAATPPQALPAGDLAGPPLAPQVLASGFPVLIATLAEAPVATAEGNVQIAPPGVAGEPETEAPADPFPLVQEGLDQLIAVVRSSIGRAGGREAAAEAGDGAESEAEADGKATPEPQIEAQRTAEVPSASIPAQVSAPPPRAAIGGTGELGAMPQRAEVQASLLPERSNVAAPAPSAADERTRHARMPVESGTDGEAGIRIEAASLPQARVRSGGVEAPQVRRATAAAAGHPAAAEEARPESERAEFPAPAAVVRTAQPAQPAVPPLQPNVAVPEQPQPQPMSAAGPVGAGPAEPAVDRQLDLALDGEWLDQLARDIARSSNEGRTPLRFRLHPEHLGHLKVEIVQDAGGAAVRLTADNEAARSIIADAQPRLIAEARAQGVRISEAHVDLGGQQTPGDPRREQAQQEPALRTARLLHDGLRDPERDDGKPTPARAERYA